MSDKKNWSSEEKEQLAEAVCMKNVRTNIKIRCVGENVRGKVIEKLEFIENG